MPLREVFISKSKKFIPITKEDLPNKIIEGDFIKVIKKCTCSVFGPE